MRILAIRGCNLTSFAGPFAMELATGPLAASGVFSITGRTGSGKSSLLDAMCLALFNTAPRLDRASSARIGRADEDEDVRLLTSDPRQLVRRGTAEGWAEVDFLARDGHRYRARWAAHRAGRSPQGKFQPVVWTLRDLDEGKDLAEGPRDVSLAVQRTLGLTYDQFRRSALLAQGDFARFLECKRDERAALLEQMTGTELYSEISKAAFARSKQAREELARLGDQIDDVPVLGEADRASLEARIASLGVSREAARRAVVEVETALRWFDELAKRRSDEANAEAARDGANAAIEEVATLRREVDEASRARSLRALVDHARASVAERERAAARLAAAAAEAERAADAQAAAKAKCDAADAAHRDALAALDAARGDLERAATLDAKVADTRRQLAVAESEARSAANARDAAAAALATIDRAIAAATTERDAHGTWLDAHVALAPLAAEWSRWKAQLERAANAHGERAAAERAGDEATARRASCEKAVSEAAAAQADAESRLADAEAALAKAEEVARAARFRDELRAERDETAERRAGLAALATIVADAAAHAARERTEREAAARALAEARVARERAEAAERELPARAAALDEARRARDDVRAALGFEEQRALLRDGIECPLCGATEHPYATNAPVAGVLHERERRVAELDEEVNGLRHGAAEARAAAEGRAQVAGEAEGRAEACAREVAKARERWSSGGRALGVDAGDADPAGLAVVERLAARLESRLAELRAAETSADETSRAAAALVGPRDRARTASLAAAKASEAAREQLSDAAHLVARHADAAERARGDLVAARAGLGDVLAWDAAWEQRFDRDPVALAAACAVRVTELERHREARAAAETEVARRSAERSGAAATVAERTELAAKREDERAAIAGAVTESAQARAALFAGRATAEVRRELDGKVASASAALGRARKEDQDARDLAAKRAEERAAAEASASAAAGAADDARTRLDDEIAASGLDRAALDAGLARDDLWVAASQRELATRDRALATAIAQLDAAETRRREHEASGPPAMDEPSARARLDEARGEEQRVVEELAAAKADLERDEANRRTRAERESTLAARKADAERWRILDQLVGSADGKKLCAFAQSLTLDALVAHATEHLRDLAPRYALMRAPGQDMDLQIVDHDMGDEIRGTNSLSGGESFLVSLALALALSSLAARDVRIDTLFVDEGFGTLDAGALDAVLASLDALQATGRQVGVISHVSALAEKIGTQVQVRRLSAGRSVLVVGGVEQPTTAVPEAVDRSAPKPKRTRKKALASTEEGSV